MPALAAVSPKRASGPVFLAFEYQWLLPQLNP